MLDSDLGAVEASAVIGNRLWNRADKIFLLGGLLLAISSVLNGITLFTTRDIRGPVTFLPEFLGPLLAFIGLLGLLPLIANQLRRVALGCILILMFPVIATVLGLIFYMQSPGSDPAFIVGLYMTIYVGFALGITAIGASIIYTEVPSRGVGFSLLLFATPWYGLAMVRGLTAAETNFIAFGIMAIGLLSTGYFLRYGEIRTSPLEAESRNASSGPSDSMQARSGSPEPRNVGAGTPNKGVTRIRRSTRSVKRTRRKK